VTVGFREEKKGGGSSGSIVRDADYNDCFVLCPELIRVTTQNSRFGNSVNVFQTKQASKAEEPPPPLPLRTFKECLPDAYNGESV